MDTIRVLRILEYVGPRDIVEEHLTRVVRGERPISANGGVVRAATLGTFPETLEQSDDRQAS